MLGITLKKYGTVFDIEDGKIDEVIGHMFRVSNNTPDSDSQVITASYRGEIVGVIVYIDSLYEEETIYVSRLSSVRKGVGAYLLEYLQDEEDKAMLLTPLPNMKLIDWYQSIGFYLTDSNESGKKIFRREP